MSELIITQLQYNDVPFNSLAIGDVFYANKKAYRKTAPRYAPKRGYLISNAVSVTTGDKAKFIDSFLVQKV